ncbi:hypothetical protein GLYMA_12G218000v4 [Glycine max]|uniref:cyclin-D2-2 n=1 Tax=Glycine max TaxID=3847 RepID=UPI000E21B773|nr:cyclin-D2-2 [Glycine max]KAH1144339.1 hypothetical protein GYH30_034529 [Glycine max]KAH1222744.1 putative cyclin-D6-1 [Glycine max]KRH27154.2 hypothetical protein GLYMA_12G218000v4 [Glycine max]|eukprot:XP_025980523.1 cyclin-D2-2 [Glycine max]
MDSKTEFPIPSDKERQAINNYLQIEREFMATKGFYKAERNLLHRKHAVATIAKLSQGQVVDAYVAYLAMNYFDRYASSTNPFAVGLGSSVTDTVCFVATCCFMLSAKMRSNQFDLQQFLFEKDLNYQPTRLAAMELSILSGLNWRMLPITPFYFLDHYYPTFSEIGGFKRRSINEIIVQSQGVHQFTEFKPSHIAISAFLAATFVGYPSEFNAIQKSLDKPGKLEGCWRQLVHLCHRSAIEICSASGTVISATKIRTKLPIQSEEAAAEEASEIQTRKSEVQKYSTTKFIQFTVLDTEEEENVAPLIRRRRRERVEATEEGAEPEAETEATKQQGLDQGKAVTVGDSSEQKDAEAETKVNPKEHDKGIGEIEEICEEHVEAESELRLRKAKGKAKVGEEVLEKGKATIISEIVPAEEAAPKTLMNFDLRWSTSVPEYVEDSEQVEDTACFGVRCPGTILGSGDDSPLKSCTCCQCTIL